MRVTISLTVFTLLLLAPGCSLVSDFGDYKFKAADGGPGDGEGDSSANGSDGGSAGTTTGGSGGSGGSPMTACDATHPCTAPLECVSNKCVAPEREPSGVYQTSGGGITNSASYTLRVGVGMPQPMGVMSSDNYKITVGPGAGHP